MRVFVMYDLPMLTKKNKSDYWKFRGELMMNGFVMFQESIYTKLVPNQAGADRAIDMVKKIKPPEGLVQVMVITEKQFGKIINIIGSNQKTYVNNTDRIIEL